MALDPREIDRLCAEHVMGFRREQQPNGHFQLFHPVNGVACTSPNYSTDIAAAWAVVKKMREDDLWLILEEFSPGWRAEFCYANEQEPQGMHNKATAPMAICLAALKAKGIEVEN